MNKASGISAELFHILKVDAVKMMHSVCQNIWKTQQWSQDWIRSAFIPIPKKVNAKECSSYHTIALISYASKVMLKILQARLQQYMNQELPDVEIGFRKCRGTRDQKQQNFRKTSTSVSLTMQKPLTVWITTNWEILQEVGIPDHLTCILRSLYASQETTVRTRHRKTDWFQIGKGVHQAVYCHPAYLNYMQSTS